MSMCISMIMHVNCVHIKKIFVYDLCAIFFETRAEINMGRA